MIRTFQECSLRIEPKKYKYGEGYMNYWIAGHTDVGLNRKVNQDAYCFQTAQTDGGKVVFAVLCDGVGGMSCGEISSATVVKSFYEWFEKDFSICLLDEDPEQKIINDWAQLLDVLNRSIQDYGLCHQLRTGTTVSLLLLMKGAALMVSIGDSRVYWISEDGTVRQISHDQTLAQKEYELGRLSKTQLQTDKRSHVLLQCVGASNSLQMNAVRLDYSRGDSFVLCTDGFYRKLNDFEIADLVQISKRSASEKGVKEELIRHTEMVKNRNESDNITAIAMLTY